jgi:4'-phosphopantetheinyl transferase
VIECSVWWAVPLPAEAKYLQLLDSVEAGRFEAYRNDIDKRRFLTGRALAKTVVGEWLGRSPKEVEFDAACEDCGKPHGRPRVPGADLTFSISHSGDRIGLAMTAGPPVGIDVETATRTVDDSLIEYALNSVENATLAGLAGDDKSRAFFTYWTRKEALMKATGKGLRIPLQSITLSGPGEPARLVSSDHEELGTAHTRLADLDPGDGYRAAVAVLTDQEIKVSEEFWQPW